MEEKKLIEKLEKIKFPEIELPTHREKLKMALIDWKYFKEKKRIKFFPFLKPAGILFLSIFLLFLITFTVWNLNIPPSVLAQKIALKNPQVKEMIEKGAKIEDLKMIDDEAYLLVSQVENELPALVKVNLKEKKVSKFEKISPENFPLTEREKEKAKEIAKIIPRIEKKAVVPQFELREIEVKEIKLVPPLELKLLKEKGEIKVIPKEKRVLITYKIDKEKWAKKINITKERVEELKFLGKE